MMFKKILFTLGASAMLLASCDDIDINDRFGEYQPPKIEVDGDKARLVLVEEFSGQKCINCPDAAAELTKIQTRVGADKVHIVMIQCGTEIGQGISVNDPNHKGLATQFGEDLLKRTGQSSLPFMMVDRNSGPVNPPFRTWGLVIDYAVTQPTTAKLAIEPTFSPTTRTLEVTVKSEVEEQFNGTLNVWLTESDVKAPQSFKNDGFDPEHVFKHVFRASATPVTGDAFEVKVDQGAMKTYTFQLQQDWVPENMEIVAFMDKGNDIVQTAVKHVIPE